MKNLRPTRTLALLLLAGALAATGCGTSSSPTAPTGAALTQEAADDIAQQSLLALDQLWFDRDGAAALFVPTAGARGHHRAVQDTTFPVGPLQVSLDWTFYGPLDEELPGYGPTAVKLAWSSHLWGVVESARDTAVVRHHADLTFTGIQRGADAFVIDRTAAHTLLDRFRSLDGTVVRDGSWKSALVLAAVVQPKSPGAWPASGTLTYTVRADRFASGGSSEVERSWSAVVVVAFDGTSHPDVSVNGTWHYTWDMVAGTLTRV